MSDITLPVIIRKTHTTTEIFDRMGNITERIHTTTDVFYTPEGSTLNEFTSPNGTITDTLRIVKERVCTTALYAFKLGQLSIPYVKRGTTWGYEKTTQITKTAVPYVKLGLTKIGNVLTNNILSSQQQNDPTERNIGAADTTISDSANFTDHLVSEQARSHQSLRQACSTLPALSYCSNAASSSQVMNDKLLLRETVGNFAFRQ